MKAVLIMDMPKGCGECSLFQDVYCDMVCKGNMRTIDYPYPRNFRKKWCPLTELRQDGIRAKWLYRLESISPANGLWYNSNNEFCFGIGRLDNCSTKNLPMGYDERYHKDGRNWFSSCSKKEDLLHWYSLENALELIANGFVFARYLATEYIEYDNETTFIKGSALAREEMDIKILFNY